MDEQNPLIGLQIDNYHIRSLLGKGGMASVYLASDVSLKRDVVIKVLLPALAENEELRLRFQREAQATARLHHPNIVQVYTTGSLPNGLPYIALQFIEGGALSDYLHQLTKQGQWISTIYALSITRQMASALQAAHQANIVHRDLKPSNILLRMDGTPVLSDLGIASVQQATMRLTQTGGIIGTPNYMSPEQASSQMIDGRSDIYSLGVILYELLSGRLPFDADSPWAILHQHIYEQPTPLAQIRPDLTTETVGLVAICLQKKPGDRFATAQAMVTALDAAIAAENANPLITMAFAKATVFEPVPSPVPRAAQPRSSAPPATNSETKSRSPWPYLLIIALLLLLSIGGILIWQPWNADDSGAAEIALPTLTSAASTAQPQPAATIAAAATVEIVAPTVQTQPTIPVSDWGFARIEAVVDATQFRNETGINVVPGQTVSIIYEEGQWRAGPGTAWPLVGPEGDPQVPSKPVFPVPAAPIASLIAGIGSAPPLYIGPGRSFVANSGGNLWLAANDDGYADNIGTLRVRIQLGPLPEETADTNSTSLGLVAYSCGSEGQKQIYLFDLDKNQQLPLANQPGNSIVPAFSRDGAQIAYRSDGSGTYQIYTSAVDGSDRRQVTNGGGGNFEAVWSPDGRQMAFVSDRTGSKQIFVMDSDGSNQQQLTYNTAHNDDPSWSVAGQIAYESDQDGRYNVYQITSAGGVPLLLIDVGSSSTTPAWSPDGTKLAFESRDGDMRQIWIANSDGTNLERVTSQGTNNQRPAWSPDGQRIAFHSNYLQASDSSADIWLIDIESGDLERLTSRGDCSDPAWGGLPHILEQQAPLIIDGVEACSLAPGDIVTAGSNTRLWETPDVLAGQALESVDSGTSLRVISGPDWQRIRRDAEISGWWWQVERPSDGLAGWVWQARLTECEGP